MSKMEEIRLPAHEKRVSRILLAGDVGGNFSALFDTVAEQVRQAGPFDALLCVGSFFRDDAVAGSELTCMPVSIPLPTFFVDSLISPCGQALGVAHQSSAVELVSNLTFLGGVFSGSIAGLSVAGMSGRFDKKKFEERDGLFQQNRYYTQTAVSALCERGADLLLCADQGAVEGSDLLKNLAPRYVIVGSTGTYHVQPPGSPQRLITLGRVGGPARWLHALSLTAPEEPPAVKRARNISPPKRDDESPREIFVANIPYNLSAAGLEGALKKLFGKFSGFVGIKKMVTDRGFAIISFTTGAHAAEAVKASQDASLGPRKLNVQLSRPPGDRGVSLSTSPDADCWFCLANPSLETHVIFGVDESTHFYAARAKGALTDGHSLLCPVTHYGCFAQCPSEVQVACVKFVKRITHMFPDKHVIAYERWIPTNAVTNHMQLHLVPVDTTLDVDWVQLVKTKGKQAGIDFFSIRDIFDVTEKMKGITHRVSYLLISVPDQKGQFVSLLGMGKMSFTFPREIICDGLNKPDRIDWKVCQTTEAVETEQAGKLRELFNQGDHK